MSAGMPSRVAASATPWAWLPEEKATTPPLAAFCSTSRFELVVGAAELEGADPLEGLELHKNASAQPLVQRG